MGQLQQIKDTFFLRLYTFLKIPLLWWVHPTVIENSRDRTILKIPLTRRTRNHLKVMYFGALGMGAEATIALKAVQAIEESGQKIDYIFKDFKAAFHKRAEGDVHFICEQGPEVRALVDLAIETKERQTQTFKSFAIVPSKNANEKVAEFEVTLSVKLRTKK